MVADSDLPYFCGFFRQRRKGFGPLAQTMWRTAIPFSRRYVSPIAERVGADFRDIAAPEIGNALTGKKNFTSLTADVGKKSLRKQPGGGKIRKSLIFEQEEIIF